MAKAAKTIIVKKRWVSVRAPKLFNNVVIGETFVAEPKDSVGKKLTVSLASLTNEHQKQSTLVTFQMTGFGENELTTETREIKLAASAIKRAVRRNRKKVSDSFVVKTKDNKHARFKTIVVTRFKTNSSILAAIKKETRDLLARASGKLEFEQICNDLLSGKLQKALGDTLKKIYPINLCEVRWFKLEKDGAAAVESAEEQAPAAPVAADAA